MEKLIFQKALEGPTSLKEIESNIQLNQKDVQIQTYDCLQNEAHLRFSFEKCSSLQAPNTSH